MSETIVMNVEYFCTHCYELRLTYKEPLNCGHCGGSHLVVGSVGELDKVKLTEKYKAQNEMTNDI